MRFFRILSLLLLGALIFSGCNTSSGTSASANSSAKTESDSAGQRRVNTVAAAEKPMEDLVVVTGTLAAEQEIVLGLKVAGRVSELPVDLGSTVRSGDVIAK